MDDIFFSFADAVLLNWNCVERPGPCWSRIDRPSTTVSPPSWPAYSRSRRTTMAAELLDVHGLILVIIFHVCTHSFFLLSAGYFQFNPKDILSRARRREREVSFFFIFLLCIDGRVSRRSRPDDVTTHSAESHTWLLLVVPMPPPFVFNGGKKPAALEIDLFLFRLVVPVVDSVSIETMCSSSSSSSSPLSSSLSFLTLSGQPNESYRSTARPAGKILKKE